MKALFVLLMSVCAVNANAKITITTPSSTGWASGQDADDLIAYLKSVGIKGYDDVLGYPVIELAGSIKFDKVKCGQGTLTYGGVVRISFPETMGSDDRWHGNDVMMDLNQSSDQCQPNSGAEKFLRVLEKLGATPVEPSVIDSLGFTIECGTGTPARQPAYQYCSVRIQRDMFLPDVKDGGTVISPGAGDGHENYRY